MKTLAQLWAEKKTPTIRVCRDNWCSDDWFEVFYTSKNTFAHGLRSNGDSEAYFLNADDDVWLLVSNPPATKRVYQALFKAKQNFDGPNYGYFLDSELYENETEAREALGDKFMRLIKPGFEVPE